MDAEQIRGIINARIEFHRTEQESQHQFVKDTLNRWDVIDDIIQSLEGLRSEFDAALAPPPQS